MGRRNKNQNDDKKAILPQLPKGQESDGVYVEYFSELADYDDHESIERMNAADARARARKNK